MEKKIPKKKSELEEKTSGFSKLLNYYSFLCFIFVWLWYHQWGWKLFLFFFFFFLRFPLFLMLFPIQITRFLKKIFTVEGLCLKNQIKECRIRKKKKENFGFLKIIYWFLVVDWLLFVYEVTSNLVKLNFSWSWFYVNFFFFLQVMQIIVGGILLGDKYRRILLNFRLWFISLVFFLILNF